VFKTRCTLLLFTLWGIKTHQIFLPLREKGYPILIIFGTHTHVFMTQLVIKWPFSFPPYPTSAFALPLKTEQTKYAIKSFKKFYKIYLSGYVATNSQSITRFDCCAADLLNMPDIQSLDGQLYQKYLYQNVLKPDHFSLSCDKKNSGVFFMPHSIELCHHSITFRSTLNATFVSLGLPISFIKCAANMLCYLYFCHDCRQGLRKKIVWKP